MTEELKREEPVPDRIGPYQLIRRLGQGGAGQVWLAKNLTKGGVKLVALKITPRSALGYGSRRRMFENEARMAVLSHSNIVQVFDALEFEGRGILVMEWVEGMDLASLLQHCRRMNVQLSLELATYVVGETLAGLAYAHKLGGGGVVHRDISPHNITVSLSGEVKILDFGTARVGGEHSSGLHVVGKPRYMPPEQTMGDSRSPTIDLFAVGAILHELLEGKRFRAGAEGGELLALARSGTVSALTRDVPSEILQLHDGLLQPDPRQRIASADDALARLEAWPGVRESSEELGLLVRRFIEPQSASASQPHAHGEDTTLGSEQPATTTERRPTTVARSAWPRWALLTFVLCLLCGFVIVGSQLRDDDQDQRHTRKETASATPIVFPISSVASGESDTGDGLVDAPAVPPDVALPQPESEARVEPRSRPRKRAASRTRSSHVVPSGTVEFLSHEYLFIEVQVGGQELELDPSVSVRLPEGRHTIRFREPPGPWQAAGVLDVDAGSVTQVRFKRPGSLSIRRIEPEQPTSDTTP